MAKRKGAGGDRFVSRLREALSRYADGVHALSAPATPAAREEAARRVGTLPASLVDLYDFSDGLWLFDDAVHVLPLAELTAAGEARLLRVGAVDGARLLCDAEGRVFEEDDDGDRLLSAASIEDDLLARVGREALLIDAEGEWREVFQPDGELSPATRRKQNEVARKRTHGAARWLVEAAELALELDGDEAAAEAALVEAIALDPAAAGARELYGVLLGARGELALGARALAVAAEESGPARRADRAAAAALALMQAGDEPERARLAVIAVASEPGLVQRLAGEAEAALAAGRLEDADRLRGLAAAVGGGSDGLSVRLRVRDRLRPVD